LGHSGHCVLLRSSPVSAADISENVPFFPLHCQVFKSTNYKQFRAEEGDVLVVPTPVTMVCMSGKCIWFAHASSGFVV
jgi:hypothetical protein